MGLALNKKRKKIKDKNIIFLIVIIICIIGLIISTNNIIKWYAEAYNTEKQINNIKEIVEVENVIENENTEIVIIEQEEEVSKANNYWGYIKMNLINVDFKELKKINPDTKGWIQVNGTNINYPFVQTNDNKYYLTHSFDKSFNSAGWVFLDYRNKINYLDKNTILYAHSRLDTTMFGSLKFVLKKDWLNDPNNHVVKLSTESENTLWKVFSVYNIPTTNDYIQTKFSSSEEFNSWISMLLSRSFHNFNTTVNDNDYILTLSTCYKDNKKMVLHAKLIKKEIK